MFAYIYCEKNLKSKLNIKISNLLIIAIIYENPSLFIPFQKLMMLYNRYNHQNIIN